MAKKAAATESRTDRVLARIAALVGLAMITGALSVVTWEVFQPERPPDLQVREVERRQDSGRYFLEAAVENRGDEPVADVEVEATGRGGAAPGRVVIRHVAGQSRQNATFVFDEEPGPVAYRVLGWSEP